MVELVPATKLRTGDCIKYSGKKWRLLDGVRHIQEMSEDDFDAHFEHQKDAQDPEDIAQRELDYDFDYDISFEAVANDGERRSFVFSISEEVPRI